MLIAQDYPLRHSFNLVMMGMWRWRRLIVIKDHKIDCHELIEKREISLKFLRKHLKTISNLWSLTSIKSLYLLPAWHLQVVAKKFILNTLICQFPWLMTSVNNYVSQSWLKISENHWHRKALKHMKVKVQDWHTLSRISVSVFSLAQISMEFC